MIYTYKDAQKEVTARWPDIIVTNKNITQRTSPIHLKCLKCDNRWQVPTRSNLLSKKYACSKCFYKMHLGQKANPNKLSHQQFVTKLKAKHGDKIKIISKYTLYSEPAKFKCDNGHEWEAKNAGSVIVNGCAKCFFESRRMSKNGYKEKLKKLFDDKIIALEPYVNKRTSILHKCKIHGKFECKPEKLLYEHSGGTHFGCGKCGRSYASKALRISHKEILRRIRYHHGDKIQLLSKSKGIFSKGKFECDQGHTWKAPIISIASGYRCPRCFVARKYSIDGINFIKQITNNQSHIRHAEHMKGEAIITGASGKRYRVDGYDSKLKIVYEYHGDIWHGNPMLFKPHKLCNPFSKLTARELYKKTKRRERDIVKAGYNLIVCWEHEYKQCKHAPTLEIYTPQDWSR